ncbi:hypothetical protein PHLGIDRAFT_82728 [Phlebiopsis gigantea 11061_1 CR5-6]|uniref:DUF7721 domain-containing protein n=1 Tax=Phlebiopsis gigantea (strain 11061_1 CR5-6) TaxID=745531 RepID=A0A0C3PVX1_PHLG1|nr:hypothetical protein PHLGIDRAFT_82728 [Phlebiopsis gigantea 11061_1 CR5-6]
MDNFIKLGQQFLESRSQDSQEQQFSRQGGHEYNSPDNQPPQGYQGGGSGQGYQGGQGSYNSGRPQLDHDEVVNNASSQGSGDRSLFSSALGFINQNQEEHERPVNEQHVQEAHSQAYSQGNASSLSAGSMGSAAAMQVLKQFTSSSGGGGGSQSQLISMAMAEATKLFDSAGGAASGNKQDAVNGAAMTVMKLLVQSKFSSATGGGNSGGLGGLMGLANKFL